MPSDSVNHPRVVPADAGRLHPWSWLFSLLAYLRSFVVPLLAVLIVGRGDWWQWAIVVGVPILLLSSLVHVFTFRYWLEDDTLVLRSGVLVRRTRALPTRRIQNMGRRQNLLHRVFGVAQVQIESAGGVGTEASLSVLSLAAADRLEQLLRDRTGVVGPANPSGSGDSDVNPPLLALGSAELVRLGLISNRGLVVVAAGFAFLTQIADLFDAAVEPIVERIGSMLWMTANGYSLSMAATALAGMLLLLAMLALLRVLSIMMAMLMYHRFQLYRHGSRFSAEYGLITRIRTGTTSDKIQCIWIEETWLHRLFGRVAVRVEVAGFDIGEHNEASPPRMRWLAPICTPEQARRLLKEVMPGVDLDALAWRPVHASAVRRRFVRMLPVFAVIVVVSAWWLSPWALLLMPALAAWQWRAANGWANYSGHALDSRVFAVRRGWLSRVVVLARCDRTQVISLRRSPFDRRHGTAVVEMDTAGGTGSQRLRLPFFDETQAQSAFARLARAPSDFRLSGIGSVST